MTEPSSEPALLEAGRGSLRAWLYRITTDAG